VLFVDDEEALVQIGQEMLDYLGYEAVVRTRVRKLWQCFEPLRTV
jgi:hypothetical protein